nr:leucine-rich repeat-containing protein 2-like isoform X2 [Nerophis lumbriciformis]
MMLERKVPVPVPVPVPVAAYDVTAVRSVWEVRVRKHLLHQRKEQDRKERSALARIEQQWQYFIYCKTLKTHERNLLDTYLTRSTLHTLTENPSNQEADVQRAQCDSPDVSNHGDKRLLFQLHGDQWKDFPRELQWMTYLREWHVTDTKIQKLPDYLSCFTQLSVLEMPKNDLKELPAAIGQLSALRQLNVSYNRLSAIPAQLGLCDNLERLEVCGNFNLCQLPFELSGLKKLRHLDVSQNNLASIPVCTLRMSSLQLLDLSDNMLTDLPQDMDRLQQLQTLFVHKNHLTYLPQCLTNIPTLSMVVVSGQDLTCVPTHLCSNPAIKFIRLYDSPVGDRKTTQVSGRTRTRTEEPSRDSSQKEFLEVYVDTLKDREDVPYATTKVSISCLL